MITAPSRQRGMSPLAMIIAIIVLVTLGTFGVKTIPAYMEFNTIDTAIGSLLSDAKVGLLSENEVRSGLGKRFTINNVTAIRAEDLDVKKEGGYLIIALDYEVRKDLFSNIDVVVTFKRDYEKEIR